MRRVLLIAEIPGAETDRDVQEALDAFRETMRAATDRPLAIYRATEADLQALGYDPEYGDDTIIPSIPAEES